MRIEKERMNEYLERVKGCACPLCRGKQWKITDRVFVIPELEVDKFETESAAIPVLPLTCVNCGNTFFINVLAAKLADKPQGKKVEPLRENKNEEEGRGCV